MQGYRKEEPLVKLATSGPPAHQGGERGAAVFVLSNSLLTPLLPRNPGDHPSILKHTVAVVLVATPESLFMKNNRNIISLRSVN